MIAHAPIEQEQVQQKLDVLFTRPGLDRDADLQKDMRTIATQYVEMLLEQERVRRASRYWEDLDELLDKESLERINLHMVQLSEEKSDELAKKYPATLALYRQEYLDKKTDAPKMADNKQVAEVLIGSIIGKIFEVFDHLDCDIPDSFTPSKYAERLQKRQKAIRNYTPDL